LAREYNGDVTTDLDLASRLRQPRPLLLDGAMGTELERRGASCQLPLWSARALEDHPALVSQIHADYAAAGAELLTANTFRTQRRTLAHAGLGDRAAELTRQAVRLARAAAENADSGRRIWVAGSASTLEDCYRPDLVPSSRELETEHAAHAQNLAAGGVDAILVETMNSAREALCATRAACATGLPVLVSFVCGDNGVLLSGESLADAALGVARERPAALLVNCLSPLRVEACLPILRATGLAYGAYPNLMDPPTPGWVEGDGGAPTLSVTEFAHFASRWLGEGINVIGGCCGTTPDHTRALCKVVR
jgi:S-methylmethionine-dependent homocysteine/selenocysteine methylase